MSLCVLKLTLVPIPCSERMSLHCARKVGGEEQSELYKHIKRAVGHGEGKAKQSKRRPIRKVITSEINGHRSPNVKMGKRACVHARPCIMGSKKF